MSNSQYLVGGVTNWDSRFRILDGSGLEPTYNPTPYKQSGAEAFGDRYYAANGPGSPPIDSYNGVHGGVCGYAISGTDIGAIYREKNFAELSLPGASYNLSNSDPDGLGNEYVNVASDGHIYTFDNDNGVVDWGRWLASGFTASNYRVRFTKTGTGSNFSGLTSGTFYDITTDRKINLAGAYHTVKVCEFTIKIEKILDNYQFVEVAGNSFNWPNNWS